MDLRFVGALGMLWKVSIFFFFCFYLVSSYGWCASHEERLFICSWRAGVAGLGPLWGIFIMSSVDGSVFGRLIAGPDSNQ